jgi:hypothetical protein
MYVPMVLMMRAGIGGALLDDPRLDHVEHVAVAIVVVADVLLVEFHRRWIAAGVGVAAPLHDDVLAVGIDRGPKDQDRIVEDLADFRLIRPREEVVRQLRRMLGTGDLGSVQAAADIDEHLPFARERASRRVSEAFGMRDALIDLLEVLESREVLRR